MTTPWRLRQAARFLRGGGVIAYPTEAVYGLGCDPLNETAVHRLLALKQRDIRKGLILIAAELAQLAPFLDLDALPATRLTEIQAGWPGPHTWVIPASPFTPAWIRGQHDSVAVRVTAHPVAGALCRAAGMAIVSTSANRAGHPPARTPQAVRRQFGQDLDFTLSGALGTLQNPTPIRDARSGEVLRR